MATSEDALAACVTASAAAASTTSQSVPSTQLTETHVGPIKTAVTCGSPNRACAMPQSPLSASRVEAKCCELRLGIERLSGRERNHICSEACAHKGSRLTIPADSLDGSTRRPSTEKMRLFAFGEDAIRTSTRGAAVLILRVLIVANVGSIPVHTATAQRRARALISPELRGELIEGSRAPGVVRHSIASCRLCRALQPARGQVAPPSSTQQH